jgi:type II secretory pathway pseudopilin PulG
MLRSTSHTSHKKAGGFSLLELMLVVTVVMILAAVTVPKMMTTINDMNLRFVANDLSGLLQSARIQAVRQNSFYSVQAGALPTGTAVRFIGKPTVGYAVGNPFIPINPAITITQGPGSGAPNEAAFLAGLNFVVDPAADPPSFSPRGLPCIGALNVCNQIAGQGFVIFMRRAAVTGNIPWVSVVVNPSGHIQIWSCDANGNWIQRD